MNAMIFLSEPRLGPGSKSSLAASVGHRSIAPTVRYAELSPGWVIVDLEQDGACVRKVRAFIVGIALAVSRTVAASRETPATHEVGFTLFIPFQLTSLGGFRGPESSVGVKAGRAHDIRRS